MSKLKYKAIERYAHGWNDPRFASNEPPDQTVRRVLHGGLSPDDRILAIQAVITRDMYLANQGFLGMSSGEVHDDNIYRVSIFPDGADVMCFGLASVDSGIDGHYDQTDDLPEWVKERLAVLMILDSTPPTTEVVGIGRRISSHVYWVYSPDAVS